MKLKKMLASLLLAAGTVASVVDAAPGGIGIPNLKGSTEPQKQNALPMDPLTKIVEVFDPDNLGAPKFKLLLTNYDTDNSRYSGYRLSCDDTTLMNAMYVGLGFDIDIGSGLEEVSMNSPQVLESDYQGRMTLDCRGAESKDLYKVFYDENLPESEVLETGWKYFLVENDGSFGNNLHMVGCQGLMTAMGFDLDNAIAMDYQTSQSFFVNVGDENDINCTNGKKVGYCGEYAHAATWVEDISFGKQAYTCDSGDKLENGSPVCDDGYEAQGNQCVVSIADCGEHAHGDEWVEAITNGSQLYQCNDGESVAKGSPTCHSGSTANNGACFRSCDSHVHDSVWNNPISNGNQLLKCNDGSVEAGAITCNTDSTKIGDLCYQGCGTQDGASRSHGQSWTHPVTRGGQAMTCNNGTTEAGAITCNSGSSLLNGVCYSDCGTQDGAYRKHTDSWTQIISGGAQAKSCSNGSVVVGTLTCSSGYTKSGNQCLLDCGTLDGAYRTHGSNWYKGITNGQTYQSCVNGSVLSGSTTCNSGSDLFGNTCKRRCGSHLHDTTWYDSVTNGKQTKSCSDGTTITGALVCNSGSTQVGSQCRKGCGVQDGATRNHGNTWTHGISYGSQTLSCSDGATSVMSGTTVCNSGASLGYRNTTGTVCYLNCGSLQHGQSDSDSYCSGRKLMIRRTSCSNGTSDTTFITIDERGCGGGVPL